MMTEDTSAAVEAGDGSEDVREAPEKVEAQDTDSPEGQEEADQDSESTEGGESDEKELSEKEKRKKDRAYKAHLREENARKDREIADLTARRDRIKALAESDEAPKEADFDDYDDWRISKALWESDRRKAKKEMEAVDSEIEEVERKRTELTQTEKRLVQENFAAQVADARTRYADYDAVVTARDVPISDQVVDIVMQSDQGADVAYHLASNKALAAEISAMSPIEAARAIGRIEAQVSAPRPRTTSTAPDPISPVKGKASATKDPAKMSMSEYKKWRAAQG